MKNYFFPVIIVIVGFAYYSEPEVIESSSNHGNYSFTYDHLKLIDTGAEFLDIFLTNLMVGFILSICGFVTEGLLTLVILFWNSYLLGIVFNMSFKALETHQVLYYSKHIPIEFIAFILLSSIGFRGFVFYKETFFHHRIDMKLIPSLKEFYFPVILLFVGSIIEIL